MDSEGIGAFGVSTGIRRVRVGVGIEGIWISGAIRMLGFRMYRLLYGVLPSQPKIT